MLVLGVQKSGSITSIYIYSFSDSSTLKVVIEYLVEFCVLYNRSLLVIYLIYSDVYRLTLNS